MSTPLNELSIFFDCIYDVLSLFHIVSISYILRARNKVADGHAKLGLVFFFDRLFLGHVLLELNDYVLDYILCLASNEIFH